MQRVSRFHLKLDDKKTIRGGKMTNLFVDSKELKVLIEKYPDCPIVVVPTKNLDAEQGYPDCEFFIDEVFVYPIDNKYDIVFINQQEYKEWLYDKISDETEEMYGDSSASYIDKCFEKALKEYEKYWRKCIIISAGSRLWDSYES